MNPPVRWGNGGPWQRASPGDQWQVQQELSSPASHTSLGQPQKLQWGKGRGDELTQTGSLGRQTARGPGLKTVQLEETSLL